MRSYQFQNLPSDWSDPLPINILLPTSAIEDIRIDNENIAIEYDGTVPNVVFSARVRWKPVEVVPPATLQHYDVWVSMESAGGGSSGTITKSVRFLIVGQVGGFVLQQIMYEPADSG